MRMDGTCSKEKKKDIDINGNTPVRAHAHA